MDVVTTTEGTKTFVKLTGRLDTTNVGQFQIDIAPLLELENPDIEID